MGLEKLIEFARNPVETGGLALERGSKSKAPFDLTEVILANKSNDGQHVFALPPNY